MRTANDTVILTVTEKVKELLADVKSDEKAQFGIGYGSDVKCFCYVKVGNLIVYWAATISRDATKPVIKIWWEKNNGLPHPKNEITRAGNEEVDIDGACFDHEQLEDRAKTAAEKVCTIVNSMYGLEA